MTLRVSSITTILFATTAFLYSDDLQPQPAETLTPMELKETIRQMDSILFHAVNTCDVAKFKSMFTSDLEFYHDVSGLTNYADNVKSISQRCSGETKVRRELVEGSLEVYPVNDFGAIQIGKHRFYSTEKGRQEKLGGTFQFVHIWKNVNGDWKISRVISYDH